MGGSVDAAAAARTLEGAYAVIRSLITTPASATELQMIKSTSFEPASQTSDAMIDCVVGHRYVRPRFDQ